MKNSYFFFLVESTFFVESAAGAGAAAESTVAGAVVAESVVAGAAVADESVVVFSSELLPPSLQATKEPIAKTNNSFFIVPFFVC
jgi:hypothetical protein